jgi:two-component system sensor histidine kinase KdpD
LDAARDTTRPDPKELLRKIQAEEASSLKGKLKIFFGAAAGVGKTYAMLQSGNVLKRDGIDVVAACIITHGRKETEALMGNLESIPLKTINYHGSQLHELDIDAVLARKPKVALVDELAHTNAPGSRHEKRWQDVEELLDAGIDVHTTLNVQHLESANDIVAQITGVLVRETVPDSIFEKATEVVVVDLPADDLIQRLRDGKVYLPDQSRFALNNFFRKGNLIALRELALRCTAQRVDAQMEKYRSDESISDIWPTSDRILVCIGPGTLSARLVRAARRMATGFRAEWMAVNVETPQSSRMREAGRNNITRSLRLAEQLGAEIRILPGTNVAKDLIEYARQNNVSKIIIGKPARARWKEIIFGSIVDELIRLSGDIDVYVITGEPSNIIENPQQRWKNKPDYLSYVYALTGVVMATVVDRFLFGWLATVNLVMVYLLVMVVVAVRYGRGPSILSAITGVAAFDYFFVPPYYSFGVSDTQYLVTLAVMLVVGLTLSTLTVTVRQQALLAKDRERNTDTLYRMTREQAVSATKEHVLEISVKHISQVFECLVAVLLPDENGKLRPVEGLPTSFQLDASEFGVAQWVFMNKQMAGMGTATLPGAKALYLPLLGSKGPIGSIGVLPSTPQILLKQEQKHFLETFVNQMALAMERATLSEEVARSKREGPKDPQKID